MAKSGLFTVKTPDLRVAVDALQGVLSKIEGKSIDIPEANTIVKAANGVTSAVSADVRVRLAMPRLAEIEAPKTGA